MTNQERPVQEHEELHGELLQPGQVAVVEQEPEHSQPVEQPAESPDQADAASATEAERAESVAATQADLPIDTSEVTPVAESEPPAPSDAAETAVASSAPVADEEPAAVAEQAEAPAATEAATEESAEAPAATEAAVVAEAATEESAEAPAPTEESAETPAATEAAVVAEAATEESAETPAETLAADEVGASYTPVAESETGRPRRVKDLEPGMELEGRVTSIALYGIFVDIGVGRDGLVHISEMSDTRIDSPSDMVQIGDTVKVRVKSIEQEGRRISLTMRSRERNEPRGRARKKPDLNRDALSTLRVGDTVDGTVTGIAPFGVFVDIGVGKDGLVHISELSETRVEKAEDAVQVGQTYTFKLLEIDAEGTRISLSLRRAQRAQRMQQLEKGQILDGTVSGLAPFGAFVDIGVGRDGLVHISELSENRVNKVEDAVNVGDKITVRVLDVDPQSKRISLSRILEEREPVEPAPREAAPPPREEQPRQRREERPERPDRSERGPRQAQEPAVLETASANYGEGEEGTSNATLEDLLSKYGNGNKRDRRRRREDEEEDEDDRQTRRQRDAIRRTLQIRDDD